MARRQDGMALVSVLLMVFAFTVLAWAFVALMQGEQRIVGGNARATAALYLAEAGAEKAMRMLSADGRVTEASLAAIRGYREEMSSGRFIVETVAEDPPGTFAVTARGEAGDAVRRVRVTAKIVPKALGLGLYAGNTIALTRGARAYVVPSEPDKRAGGRAGDVAAARELWIEDDAALNTIDGRVIALRDGRVKDYALFGLSSAFGADSAARDRLPDMIATGDTELVSVTKTRLIYDHDTLRREHPEVHVRGLKREDVTFPGVDLATFSALAQTNDANRELNRAAGDRFNNRVLRDKAHSEYTAAEFEQILSYLEMRRRDSRRDEPLRGVIYVEGLVTVGSALRIEDGALVVRGKIAVGDKARLEVRHGPKSRHLPGLVASTDGGAIRFDHDATAVIDGVVYASTGVQVSRASVDISGAILTGQGTLVDGGLVVIRYQTSVMGTIGLTRTPDAIVRPTGWRILL